MGNDILERAYELSYNLSQGNDYDMKDLLDTLNHPECPEILFLEAVRQNDKGLIMFIVSLPHIPKNIFVAVFNDLLSKDSRLAVEYARHPFLPEVGYEILSVCNEWEVTHGLLENKAVPRNVWLTALSNRGRYIPSILAMKNATENIDTSAVKLEDLLKFLDRPKGKEHEEARADAFVILTLCKSDTLQDEILDWIVSSGTVPTTVKAELINRGDISGEQIRQMFLMEMERELPIYRYGTIQRTIKAEQLYVEALSKILTDSRYDDVQLLEDLSNISLLSLRQLIEKQVMTDSFSEVVVRTVKQCFVDDERLPLAWQRKWLVSLINSNYMESSK